MASRQRYAPGGGRLPGGPDVVKQLFHVGVIVPRLEAGLDHFSTVLGLSWMPIVETEVPVSVSDGADRLVALRFAYSVEDPHLEVIEEAPDSVWVCNPGSNLHHIGFWADDLTADSRHLQSSTCPIEIAGYTDTSARGRRCTATTPTRWACVSSWSTAPCGP